MWLKKLFKNKILFLDNVIFFLYMIFKYFYDILDLYIFKYLEHVTKHKQSNSNKTIKRKVVIKYCRLIIFRNKQN